MNKLKVYLDPDKSVYCIVKLFDTKEQMQVAYAKACPRDSGHFNVCGVHHAYEKFDYKNGKRGKLIPESGTVYLNREYCGAGVVTHELMHAVLWSRVWKKRAGKKSFKQFPIVIKSMEEEEEILGCHTFAVNQFYQWYWFNHEKI